MALYKDVINCIMDFCKFSEVTNCIVNHLWYESIRDLKCRNLKLQGYKLPDKPYPLCRHITTAEFGWYHLNFEMLTKLLIPTVIIRAQVIIKEKFVYFQHVKSISFINCIIVDIPQVESIYMFQCTFRCIELIQPLKYLTLDKCYLNNKIQHHLSQISFCTLSNCAISH